MSKAVCDQYHVPKWFVRMLMVVLPGVLAWAFWISIEHAELKVQVRSLQRDLYSIKRQLNR